MTVKNVPKDIDWKAEHERLERDVRNLLNDFGDLEGNAGRVHAERFGLLLRALVGGPKP